VVPLSVFQKNKDDLFKWMVLFAKQDWEHFHEIHAKRGFKRYSNSDGESPCQEHHVLKCFYLKFVIGPSTQVRQKLKEIMDGQAKAKNFATEAARSLQAHSLKTCGANAEAALLGRALTSARLGSDMIAKSSARPGGRQSKHFSTLL
jgi:hypothetical protein